MTETTSKAPNPSLRAMLIPLALAQFICSFAGSNMNVMINDISVDLHTTVQGVQVCITLFLLVMAALMIPCGKLTDRIGRTRCFRLGLTVYGIGAVLARHIDSDVPRQSGLDRASLRSKSKPRRSGQGPFLA